MVIRGRVKGADLSSEDISRRTPGVGLFSE